MFTHHITQILLLVADDGRRDRLRQACETRGAVVRCVESLDLSQIVFIAAPDRLNLLVLDPAMLLQHGLAWLANWRRMAPRGQLVLLPDEPDQDLRRLERALQSIRLTD